MSIQIDPNFYFREVLNKFFPKAQLKSSTIWESGVIKPDFFDGEISTYNLFEQTPYEYKGHNRFIHFTSSEKLKAILKSGYLRMASLDSLEDDEEVHFAAKVIDPNCTYELGVASENLFSLSACESSHSNITNENMWMEYGDKHAGCILEYSFSKMELFRMNFGVIKYGKDEISDLKQLAIVSKRFYDEFGYTITKLPVFLKNILAFHKKQFYDFEREIRLLFEPLHIRNDDFFGYEFCDKKGIKTYYKLPFKERNELPENTSFDLETKLHHYPQIELKRVILGAKTSKTELKEIKKLIQEKFQNCECIKL
jgi:hypothetical protein